MCGNIMILDSEKKSGSNGNGGNQDAVKDMVKEGMEKLGLESDSQEGSTLLQQESIAGKESKLRKEMMKIISGIKSRHDEDGTQKEGITVKAKEWMNYGILLVVFFIMALYKHLEYAYQQAWLRFYTVVYYPNRTPQLIRDDVSRLNKLPRHVACILQLKDEKEQDGAAKGLVNGVGELAAWAVLAGVPALTIYESTGELKYQLANLRRHVSRNLAQYFGEDSTPTFVVKVPHSNISLYGNGVKAQSKPLVAQVDLEITLLSRVDGKPTIVELTKAMSELARNGELVPEDITIGLIDEELQELVGPEPDLLISFNPYLDLQDYPPWHIRLSEIYWEKGNSDINYAVFVRALQRFSNCKVNLGK